MTDAQDPTSGPAVKRARSKREKPSTNKSEPRGYAAMHEVNAAMCLAGGILAPRYEQSAAQDHHVAAGALQIEAVAPSAQTLLDARGDLSYGNVVVFEVPAPIAGSPPARSLPLWRATRLVFESRDACDIFCARMSGYGDVPGDILAMSVDPALFAARLEAGQPSLLENVTAAGSPSDVATATTGPDSSAAKHFRAIDRSAGALLGAVSTLQGPSAARVVQALGGLSAGQQSELPVEQLALAIAQLVDPSPDAATYAPVLSAMAGVLSTGTMDDGFSAKALLREAEPASCKGLQEGSAQLQAVQRFWTFTKDVLELRREVPDGAWSDDGGSAMARGALLFLLNPEPEQLRAVRDRIPGVGTAVHFIAGLLVGIRSGLTRMGTEVKSARDTFMAGAAFAHDYLLGRAPELAMQRNWDAEDGSTRYALLYEGTCIAAAKEPAEPLRVSLAVALRAIGLDARFSPVNGDLCARLQAGSADVVFGLIETFLSTFPRQAALEAWALVPVKLARSALVALVADVNARTHEHCVAAQHLDGPAGRAGVRLSVFVIRAEAVEPLKEAVAALAAKASEVALHVTAKPVRRASVGKAASAATPGFDRPEPDVSENAG